MSALTVDRKTDQFGTPDTVFPQLLSFPVAASTTLYGGSIIATNSAGNAVATSASSAIKCWGRAEFFVDNSAGAAAAKTVTVRPGVFLLDNGTGGDALTKADVGNYVFASDDHTANKTDAGGTRALLGVMYGIDANGQIYVGVGVPFSTPYSTNPELGASGGARARMVATSLAAYTAAAGVLTANANGAIAAQDGLTVAVNDVIVVPPGVAAAAKDSGVYVATAIGGASAKFVLTRIDYWPTAAVLKSDATSIAVGGEGTVYKNSTWKAFIAADTFTVDTDDPKLYPARIVGTAVLVAGTVTLSLPIFSASSSFQFSRKVANTSTATTGGYHATVAGADGITPGAIGTGSAVVQATVAAGTINNADISTLHYVLDNQL